MLKKSLAVGIIFFLVVSSVPYSIQSNEISTGTFDGNTIYVDDDNTAGPWDGSQEHPYQFIQDGMNHASNGDTVFVYNGVYHENVIINKPIVLIGESRNTTIIDGLNKASVIHVKAESVSIENFTIRNGTYGVYNYYDKTSISHNIIINNDKGIKSSYSKNVNITGNIISKNNYGITFYRTYDSIIKGNHILSNKKIGILFTVATMPGLGSDNNIVSYNIIQKSTIGVYLETVSNNDIINNNFYCNVINAFFVGAGVVWLANYWDGNYWNLPRVLPKPIFGILMAPIPFVKFDWHPAKEPYDIEVT